MTPLPLHSRSSRILMAAVIAVSSLVIGNPPTVVSADDTAIVGDESVTAVTGSWVYAGLTVAQVSERLTANGARLTDVEVNLESDGSPRLAVTMVSNSGAYAVSGWWWYVGLTAAEVSDRLTSNDARLIDVQPYQTTAGTRFAVVMVSNSGASARAWWWYHGATVSQLDVYLRRNDARLVDLEAYDVGGSTRYTAVMIRNTGQDAQVWDWYVDQTSLQVRGNLTAFNGRVVDITRQPDGRYAFVMVKQPSTKAPFTRLSLDARSISDVVEFANQFGGRVVDLDRSVVDGEVRYQVVLIDNLTPEHRVVTNKLLKPYLEPFSIRASVGLYVRRVGFSEPLFSLNASRRFEPASAIKTLHGLALMREVANTPLTLSSKMSYYNYPNSRSAKSKKMPPKDYCPLPSDEVNKNKVSSTAKKIYEKMMQQSDNRTTRTLTKRYGLTALNDLANSLGMTSTKLRQALVGCGWDGGKKNLTTLVDLGRLYEAAMSPAILPSTDQAKTTFWTGMSRQGAWPSLEAVINDEAYKLGVSASVRVSFLNSVGMSSKGGSYNMPCATLSTPCDPDEEYAVFRAAAGRIGFPILERGLPKWVFYVWGNYYTEMAAGKSESLTPFTDANYGALAEALRPVLRAGLATYIDPT